MTENLLGTTVLLRVAVTKIKEDLLKLGSQVLKTHKKDRKGRREDAAKIRGRETFPFWFWCIFLSIYFFWVFFFLFSLLESKSEGARCRRARRAMWRSWSRDTSAIPASESEAEVATLIHERYLERVAMGRNMRRRCSRANFWSFHTSSGWSFCWTKACMMADLHVSIFVGISRFSLSFTWTLERTKSKRWFDGEAVSYGLCCHASNNFFKFSLSNLRLLWVSSTTSAKQRLRRETATGTKHNTRVQKIIFPVFCTIPIYLRRLQLPWSGISISTQEKKIRHNYLKYLETQKHSPRGSKGSVRPPTVESVGYSLYGPVSCWNRKNVQSCSRVCQERYERSLNSIPCIFQSTIFSAC